MKISYYTYNNFKRKCFLGIELNEQSVSEEHVLQKLKDQNSSIHIKLKSFMDEAKKKCDHYDKVSQQHINLLSRAKDIDKKPFLSRINKIKIYFKKKKIRKIEMIVMEYNCKPIFIPSSYQMTNKGYTYAFHTLVHNNFSFLRNKILKEISTEENQYKYNEDYTTLKYKDGATYKDFYAKFWDESQVPKEDIEDREDGIDE